MMQGLMDLLDADIASYGEGVITADHGTPGWLQVQMSISCGWPNASDQAVHDRVFREGRIEVIPWFSAEHYRTLLCPPSGFSAIDRPRLFNNSRWERTEFFQQCLRPAHCNEWLLASHAIDNRVVRGMVLLREPTAKPFEERERRLLSHFYREHARFFGTKLASYPGPSVLRLSPRLRDTLLGLVRGESEKEIARSLAISRHTVHEHVKRLHRHFGASSRGELLSVCSRFRPVLDALGAGEVRQPNLVDPDHDTYVIGAISRPAT
jgi:DNA-binding CsgD family transcriptional regulator